MTEKEIDSIRDTYHEAAKAVGLPAGIDVEVVGTMGVWSGGENKILEVTACLVTESGEWHAVAKHQGLVKSVHAERHLKAALDDFSRRVN